MAAVLIRDRDGKILAESPAMRALRRIGRDDLAWSLRRLHVPVTKDALVLEVGSGGNPFPRANVLLDAYEATRERHFQTLVADRPLVLGMLEKLPFRDDAFDFVIACHVLEHAIDVEASIRELQRVARAGYIECPDAFFERINPYHDHRLELTERGGVLRISRKPSWIGDADLVELYEAKVQPTRKWQRQLRENPFAFHLRYFWSRDDGGIRYELVGKDVHQTFEGGGEGSGAPPPKLDLRKAAVMATRGVLSQRRRNTAFDVTSVLQCVQCGAARFSQRTDSIQCSQCMTEYARARFGVRMHRPET